jgi:hypothetical protein
MDLLRQADWDEFYTFFTQGSPPLAIQILLINTIFFILWIVRRMRGAPALRRGTSIAVQALLIPRQFRDRAAEGSADLRR